MTSNKDFDLKELVRPNIWELAPYSSARNEFSGEASVWLDANESPFNEPYNRYPDPLQRKVKQKLSKINGVDASRIFLGNGSDECIDMVYRVFCEPGASSVVAIAPSYGMYEVCAGINNVFYRKVMLGDGFSLDVDAMLDAVTCDTRAMWVCSPNNPTGNAFPVEQLVQLCQRFHGIVVVDEAYGDFSSQPSMLGYLDQLPNLIVLHTLSKAWGSAGVRLGMAFASQEIIDIFNKVKYPYNVNVLTQRYASEFLDRWSEVKQWVETIKAERGRLITELGRLPQVLKLYSTDANFVLAQVSDADAIYDYLCRQGIVVRNRNRVEKCLGCLRITVGAPRENDQLIKAISQYGKGE